MILTNNYNSDTKTEKVWYESSNIFYTEFIEDSQENKGDLFVTFKNGATYKYKDVKIAPDYLMFKHGGLDGSQGKALNKHIKPNYEYERVGDRDTAQLAEEKELCIKNKFEEIKNKTVFVSGHRDITEDEFMRYKSEIASLLDEIPDALFVIGDYHGVDIMTQNFLVDELSLEPERVTVYHMSETPMNINPKIKNTVGGFISDEERDMAMTANSFRDIAFVREHTKMSGTAQNILRRFLI